MLTPSRINPMEEALAVVEQKEVEFYGDTIIAVRAQGGGVYVPVRPMCRLLGVDWSAQPRRIGRFLQGGVNHGLGKGKQGLA